MYERKTREKEIEANRQASLSRAVSLSYSDVRLPIKRNVIFCPNGLRLRLAVAEMSGQRGGKKKRKQKTDDIRLSSRPLWPDINNKSQAGIGAVRGGRCSSRSQFNRQGNNTWKQETAIGLRGQIQRHLTGTHNCLCRMNSLVKTKDKIKKKNP